MSPRITRLVRLQPGRRAGKETISNMFTLEIAEIERQTNMQYWSKGKGEPYTFTPKAFTPVTVEFPTGVTYEKAVQLLAKAVGKRVAMNKSENAYYSPADAEFNKTGYGSVIVMRRSGGTTSSTPVLAVKGDPEFDAFMGQAKWVKE